MRLAGIGDSPSAASAVAPAAERSGGTGSDFGARFEAALADLDATATAADATSERLVTGEVDIHEAMVAMEKADLALRVAGTVRTKVLDAYQQLMQAAGS